MDQDRLPTPSPEERASHEAVPPRQAVGRSWVVRAPLLFAGVILPVVCFLVVNLNVSPLRPPPPGWSGYAAQLLMYPASAALSPFLLYCMISMGLLVFRPGDFENNNFVRFGIFSGVLLAAEYCAIYHSLFWDGPGALAYEPVFCMVSAFGVLVPMGILWVDARLVRKEGVASISVGLALLIALFGAVSRGFGFLVILAVCLWFSTAWALAAYAFVSIRLIAAAPPPRFRFTLAQLLAFTTWFAAHYAAWRCAYVWTLHEYLR